jgi:hypothetical protein
MPTGKQEVGAALSKDITLRTLRAADIAGIRALVVYAKDNEAKELYERFDFVSSPSNPLQVFHVPQRLSEDNFIRLSIIKRRLGAG